MSNDQANPNDPLGFVRNMWGNMGFSLPGMVTPTFDTEELEKRIKDLKAVEGWLRMNLSMLQMTIQGLEMQTSTLSAVKAMGSMAASAAQQAAQQVAPEKPAPAAPQPPAAAAVPPGLDQAAEAGAHAAGALSQAAMWPWNLMQQMQEHLQEQAEAAKAAKPAKAAAKRKPAAAAKPKTTASAAKQPRKTTT